MRAMVVFLTAVELTCKDGLNEALSRLQYAGVTLQDKKTLSEYGITSGAELTALCVDSGSAEQKQGSGQASSKSEKKPFQGRVVDECVKPREGSREESRSNGTAPCQKGRNLYQVQLSEPTIPAVLRTA